MKSDTQHPTQTSLNQGAPEWLSALADGQAEALEPGCAQWRDDEQARRTWHTYHLIGDVMRSEELASDPARDAAFMTSLRSKLAQEPVVLAPSAPLAPPASRSAWHMPAAVAAGCVLVAGVMVVARMGPMTSPASAPQLAAAAGAQPATLQVQTSENGQALIIDPRLNEFLRAHQSAAGGMAAPSPGGSLRRAEMVVPVPVGR